MSLVDFVMEKLAQINPNTKLYAVDAQQSIDSSITKDLNPQNILKKQLKGSPSISKDSYKPMEPQPLEVNSTPNKLSKEWGKTISSPFEESELTEAFGKDSLTNTLAAKEVSTAAPVYDSYLNTFNTATQNYFNNEFNNSAIKTTPMRLPKVATLSDVVDLIFGIER